MLQQRVIESLESANPEPNRKCKRNLLHLQLEGSTCENDFRQKKWRHKFQLAICRSIYSHNWDKLLYLLKKSPPWEHKTERLDELSMYIRVSLCFLRTNSANNAP